MMSILNMTQGQKFDMNNWNKCYIQFKSQKLTLYKKQKKQSTYQAIKKEINKQQ